MKPGRIELHIGRLVVDGPEDSRERLQAVVAEALQRALAQRWSAQAAPGPMTAVQAPRWVAPLADAIAARWTPAADATTPIQHQAPRTGARDV